MSILTGAMILEEVRNGNIEIDPFRACKLNPNSYNLSLANELKVYKPVNRCKNVDWERLCSLHKINGTYIKQNEPVLDAHADNAFETYTIPEEGFLMVPGILYLGSTIERTYTSKYIPMVEGRSSAGRLGLSVHVTAGFGDIGFNGRWTLEITVVHPLIIYPNDEILQIAFHTPEGNTAYQYNGRYNNQTGTVTSKFYQAKEEKSTFMQCKM